MDYFPFPQETNGGDDIRVINQPQDIIIGGARLLLGSHILGKVGDGVTGGLEGSSRERHTACRLRPDAGGVIHKIGCKAGILDLLDGEVFGKLMDDGANHLQVRQLFGTQRSIGNVPMHQI